MPEFRSVATTYQTQSRNKTEPEREQLFIAMDIVGTKVLALFILAIGTFIAGLAAVPIR